MQLFNSNTRYGLVAILFHWLMALLLIGLLILGLYMTRLPFSLLKLKLFGWHKEWGFLILLLVILRLAWRLSNPTPEFPNDLPRWQQIAARMVHVFFYILMFALPISGWLISSASGLPLSFFGLFVLPDLISPNEGSRILLSQVHAFLAYTLIVILCMHMGAALKHHFVDKNDILRRML